MIRKKIQKSWQFLTALALSAVLLLSGVPVYAQEAGAEEESTQTLCSVYISGGYISKVNGTATETNENEGNFPAGTRIEVTADPSKADMAAYSGKDVVWRFDRWTTADLFLEEQTKEVMEITVEPSADGYLNLSAEFTATDSNGTEVPMVNVSQGQLLEVNGEAYANASFGYFTPGTVLGLKAYPEQNGQVFTEWKASPEEAVYGFADTSMAETTYKVPSGYTGRIDLTAQRGQTGVGTTHTVTVENGLIKNGSEWVSTLYNVVEGTTLTIKGNPPVQDGYTATFTGWSMMVNDQLRSIEGGETFQFTVTDEMESSISLRAAYQLTDDKEGTAYTKIVLTSGSILSVDGIKLDTPIVVGPSYEPEVRYYPAGTVLELKTDVEDGLWAQDAVCEETVQGYFQYEDDGRALYTVPAQSEIRLYVLSPGAGNPPPASTVITNGVVTSIDGKELEEPAAALSLEYGSVYGLKAKAPEANGDYRYEFTGWVAGAIYGEPGIFRDATKEETEFLAAQNGVIIAQYKAVPRETDTSGELTVKASGEEGMPGLSLKDTEDIAAAVLSPTEKEEFIAGTDISVTASISSGEAMTPDEEATVSAAAQEAGYLVGASYDITMEKKVDDKEAVQLSRTFYPVQFTLEIPKDLQKSDREYAMVRLHDGTAEVLKDLDEEAGTITFETDRFSYYTLVYKDLEDETSRPSTSLSDEATGIKVAGSFALGDQLIVTPASEDDLKAFQQILPKNGSLDAYSVKVVDKNGNEIGSSYITGISYTKTKSGYELFGAYKSGQDGLTPCDSSGNGMFVWKEAGLYGFVFTEKSGTIPEDPKDPQNPGDQGQTTTSKTEKTSGTADASKASKAAKTADTKSPLIPLSGLTVSGMALVLGLRKRK